MQEQVDKKIEKVVEKMMQEVTIQSPSINFTDAVMYQVEALESKKNTAYKPLIPKKLWYIVGFVLVAITCYLILNNTTEQSSWLSALDFSSITNNALTQSIYKFKMPKTVTYAILFFGLMICVQIPVLKHYFDKRLSV